MIKYRLHGKEYNAEIKHMFAEDQMKSDRVINLADYVLPECEKFEKYHKVDFKREVEASKKQAVDYSTKADEENKGGCGKEPKKPEWPDVIIHPAFNRELERNDEEYIWTNSPKYKIKSSGPDAGVPFRKTPKEIKEYLDNYVFSQDDAKKEAAMMAFEQAHGRKRNVIFSGPSGCGKTEIFRTLKKIDPLIYIFDASNITNDGWSGNKKFYSPLVDMIHLGYDRWQVEHSIIVFDEFDKLIEPAHSAQGDNVHEQAQGELLSLVEGGELTFTVNKEQRYDFDTSHISFAFLGAFENLRKRQKENIKAVGFGSVIEVLEEPAITMQDIVAYGLRNELAGRVNSLVQLQPFDEEGFYRIAKDEKAGIPKKIADEYGLTNFTVSDDVARKIAHDAVENGTGIRGMLNAAKRYMDVELYESGTIPAII